MQQLVLYFTLVQKVFAIQTEIDIPMMFGEKEKFNILVPQRRAADYTPVGPVVYGLGLIRKWRYSN